MRWTQLRHLRRGVVRLLLRGTDDHSERHKSRCADEPQTPHTSTPSVLRANVMFRLEADDVGGSYDLRSFESTIWTGQTALSRDLNGDG